MKISEPLQKYLIENEQLILDEHWYHLLMDCDITPDLNLWIKSELVTLLYHLGVQEVFQSNSFPSYIEAEQIYIPQYAEQFLNGRDHWIYGNDNVVEITLDPAIKQLRAYRGLFGACKNLRKIVLPEDLQELSYPANKCHEDLVIEYPGTKLEFNNVEKVYFPKDVEIMCSDGSYLVGKTKEFD